MNDSKQQKGVELLRQFLSSFSSLDASKVEQLQPFIPVEFFPKGTVLMKEGTIPDACYYVLEGLLREYRWDDGEDCTLEFYTERKGTVSARHFIHQTPSDVFVECIEDSYLIVGSREVDATNYERFPELIEITRAMIETDLSEKSEQFQNFVHASPEKRYKDFTDRRPELQQRVPLHQIASYLGMKPESLSRIRKRLVDRERNASSV